MKTAVKALLDVLLMPCFTKGDPESCAKEVKRWRAEFDVSSEKIEPCLTQFAAQLLHGVRTNDISAQTGSEMLARVIALSDLNIPPPLFALQEVLQSLADRQQKTADQSAIRQEMGRILQTIPSGRMHESDHCRYTGRYQDKRRLA